MKCFVDAREGIDRDAVAVCSICGMGLCPDHLLERELPLAPRVSLVGGGKETGMVVLCERCAQAAGITG